MSLNDLARTLPDYAKDMRLNISSLLNEQGLTDQQKYGLFVACAHACGHAPLVRAAEAEAAGVDADFPRLSWILSICWSRSPPPACRWPAVRPPLCGTTPVPPPASTGPCTGLTHRSAGRPGAAAVWPCSPVRRSRRP